MNSSYSFHLFILAVAFVILRPTGAATCHPDDEAGLLAFKSGITQDLSGLLSSWKKGTDCCSSWRYINCGEGGRVTSLVIDGTSEVGRGVLSGTISPSLAKLQHLQEIYLLNLKNISGSIPPSLFKMPNLQSLSIENSNLSGPLPAYIGTKSQLGLFSVKDNFFTGTIPLEFANLKQMKRLDLSGNHLSGTIPNILKSMTMLRDLYLSRNNFSGEFPQSITSISPYGWLTELDLSWNQFSGTVPKNLSKQYSLEILDLSHNLFTGPLPVLNGLKTLDLSYNKFNLKTVPKWITSSPTIDTVKLANCGIKMSLDDWELHLYEYMDISENQISGSPEKFLTGSNRMIGFWASGNKLRFDIGKLNYFNALQTLDLSRNLVFGKVPAAVAVLQTLNLSQNHLCGKLPVTNFPASAFLGNDCLCGAPLAPCKL